MVKYLKFAFIAVCAAIAGYGTYVSQKTDAMSDLMLTNVEALAHYEDSACPNGCVSSGKGCACNGVYYPSWKEYGS